MPPPPPAPASATARPGPPQPQVYLKSHGIRVARPHLLDWAVLVLLVALDGALNFIEPFHRFVGADMMPGLRYPLKDNTVPVWAVPVRARTRLLSSSRRVPIALAPGQD
jgi:hypothetical protein